MATEPPGDDLAARSSSSQPFPPDPADNFFQRDVSHKNGLAVTSNNELAGKPSGSIEERLASADVSLNGASDTETLGKDWLRQRDADKGHGRSASSARKPATFKAVSVNKTFLASKANPGGTAPKPMDKPMSGSSTPPPGMSSLSSSRPRLVAKTGGGARDTAPKFSSLTNGAKPGSAPDPSAVWNKNRPPEPKKFTDEELKKYGIHMASRLNEDDAPGQNKWADIDDDDEDWAPEAITWGDGTKTTLPHLEDSPAVAPDNTSVSTHGDSRTKSRSPAPTSTAKPPAAKSSGLASGRGLVLKPASQEKPCLVAKPSAPATVIKSPWATLPPVDRASPGLSDHAAVVQAQPREDMHTRSLHHQPKEITADDYSRSTWRASSFSANRELYNSQSGRYEPVPHRRGSFKSDAQTKQPALLQRPQSMDQTMEACGRQQTSLASQEGAFTRRRGSSSVSTGSGPLHQRGPRTSNPTVLPDEGARAGRLSYQTAGEGPASTTDASTSKHALLRGYPPQTRTGEPISVPFHAVDNNALDRSPSHTESKAELVNEVEYQKKLMRERIELARKRRQTEEAVEEAARKERIQKKLEALGPPPEKRGGDKKEPLPMAETPKPTQIQQRERSPFTDSYTYAVERPSSKEQTGAQPSVLGQPDSPQPSSRSQPSHPPTTAPSASFRRASQGQDARRSDPWGGPGPRPDKFSSWGSAAPPSSRNVWGSPDNDRGLGNGTFNPDLGRVTNASTVPSHHAKGSLPTVHSRNDTGAAGLVKAQGNQGTSGDSHGPRYVPPGSELASKWVASVAENDLKISTAKLAERASRERQMMERGRSLEDSQPVIRDSWRPMCVPGDGTRHAMGSVDVQSHQAAPWKPAQEGLAKGVVVKEDPGLSTKPGIIGCGPPSQCRPSRFFPTRERRHETCSGTYSSRSASPTPPPPTLEDHPVYEGDVLRPHVSLPKPQPVVKLPPMMVSTERNTARSQGSRPAQAATKDDQRGDHGHVSHPGGETVWQARFHKLLHGDRPSAARDIGVDASSRGLLEPVRAEASAIVLLPNSASTQPDEGSRSFPSKPMAEDCFEEQEMGSLPQVNLPKKAPEAAWQPAVAQPGCLPKRFLVQAAVMEAFQFPRDDNTAGPPSVKVKVLLPGMKETKTVLLLGSASRGPRALDGQRTATRHGGSGTGLRGGKKETFTSHADVAPRRSGRTGRKRTWDSWTRHRPSQSQTPPPGS